jgi:hypothetical protein
LAGGCTDMANLDIKKREPDIGVIHSIKEAEADSLTGCDSGTYGNRVHCCVVSSPAGRPLREYRSIRQLLEVLRDAIKGHKSLLEDGKILHRDVSENIIIVERPAEGDPKGRLIDLDLAKELGSLPSGASHRTGTMQFMAIEVLQAMATLTDMTLSRSFMSSYGCVFVMVTKTRATRRTELRRVNHWQTRWGWDQGAQSDYGVGIQGPTQKLDAINMGIWIRTDLKGIIAEFALKFKRLKTLARELRKVLFPIKDGAIFTGTFRDHKIMYDGVINAFDMAITDMVERWRIGDTALPDGESGNKAPAIGGQTRPSQEPMTPEGTAVLGKLFLSLVCFTQLIIFPYETC